MLKNILKTILNPWRYPQTLLLIIETFALLDIYKSTDVKYYV